MAKKQWTQVGKRKLELSNLDKILFPDDHVLKAEVIEYYLKMAPTLLNHINGRALTLIRYPDGIGKESFYQKNRPAWAPNWIEFVVLGKEQKEYILAGEPAVLVWLANLATLELHQLHSRKPNYDYPDYMVFDLDPPEGSDFKKVIDIAVELKDHLESYGYTPFAKTTGGKGIHICCPIEPRWDFHTVFLAAQDIAKPFVESRSKHLTLQLKKDARKGRMLVDIFRIRSGQSIVSPYSLRGREGAPVSMPLRWDDLIKTSSPLDYNINTAIGKVMTDGDAWDGIDAYAVDIHTHQSQQKPVSKKLPPSTKHKTPDQLATYSQKRDFQKTPEPAGYTLPDYDTNHFVIHRHHATNLHYDLRLEQDGVLKSWAVPRGLPSHPGVKRLAVQTEDHPRQYLTFDGIIPKGQYGAGEMWIYAFGKFNITKQKKDGFYFRLSSKEVSGEYRMHKMKDKEWLLERVDNPQIDYLHNEIYPMLADHAALPPVGKNAANFLYELKWDGIRVIITLEEGVIKLHTRKRNEITTKFPELQNATKAFRATCAVFDAEIVWLDDKGKPVFNKVINRMQATGPATIQKLAQKHPVYCYIFDCLYLDGRPLIQEPLLKRRAWIKDAIRPDTPFRFSEVVNDGQALFNAAQEHGLEGIMGKRTDSIYLPGKRTDTWLKIKTRQTADVRIIGFTKGKGIREDTFGALHIAEREKGVLCYRGKVGTGFDDATMIQIAKQLKKLKTIRKPIKEKPVNERASTWVEDKLFAEVSYARITPDQMFREPVFLRMRPDLNETSD